MRTILKCFLAVLLICFGLNAAEIPFEGMADVQEIENRSVSREDPTVFDILTIEKELSISEFIAGDFEKSVRQISDPAVLGLVDRIGQNIVKNSDHKMICQFKVIDTEEMDVLALLGGHIYATAGIIAAAGSEAELAGAIAHGIAHAQTRHTARVLENAKNLQVTAIPVSLPWSWSGFKVLLPAQSGMNFEGMAATHRGFEVEADRLAVQYLWNSGYDPNAYVTLLQRLLKREQELPSSRLSKIMPAIKDRITASAEERSRLQPKENYVLTTSEFESVKANLLSMSRAQVTKDIPDTPEQERPRIRHRTE